MAYVCSHVGFCPHTSSFTFLRKGAGAPDNAAGPLEALKASKGGAGGGAKKTAKTTAKKTTKKAGRTRGSHTATLTHTVIPPAQRVVHTSYRLAEGCIVRKKEVVIN